MDHSPLPLWIPSRSFVEESQLNRFNHWLAENYNLNFLDYHSMWRWSITKPADFWQKIWTYFDIIDHSSHREVLQWEEMPGAQWFDGSQLNYIEHIFRNSDPDEPAIFFRSERHSPQTISWGDLESRVASFRQFLVDAGVGKGDRVAAFLPNIPAATVAFLACASLGAVWSSSSPDFGADSVVSRFGQIKPKILIAVDGYQYNGKSYDKTQVVEDISAKIPSLEKVVLVRYLSQKSQLNVKKPVELWDGIIEKEGATLSFEAVPFSHPLWVLYSSGTTGAPKAIVHSHGGVLLEHYKYLTFHNDVRPGERYFWYSTTGWMMWNFVHASMLSGASIVLYDGSPAHPDLNVLWELTEEIGINHFGTSAPFIVACMKEGLDVAANFDLSSLRSIGSTGSPLPPEAFEYVYSKIKKDVWLTSMSGGTDVCSAFVGGCPMRPVYAGEIQCRALGCSLYAWDENGREVEGEMGEMVITKPMPSMPVQFWDDTGDLRYKSSYFEMWSGIWRHGDWIEITPRDTLIIFGRSDATLNRHGVRMGTSEIYGALMNVEFVKDCLIVNVEKENGDHFMPLFVVMEGELTEERVGEIRNRIRKECSPRHVPDEIIRVAAIPYTISGKKMERPVKRILMGHPPEKAVNRDAMKNPEAIDFFIGMRGELKVERLKG